MALFEGYERRIDKIQETLKAYGFNSIEETRDLCLSKGVDVDKIVKGVQPIAFERHRSLVSSIELKPYAFKVS